MSVLVPHRSARGSNSRREGFSLVEVLATIAALGVLAAIVVHSFSSHRVAVEQAKLNSDVNVLNNAVRLYVAEGGDLDNATTYQKVIDQLKTKSAAATARRHVGPATGRFVDPRLAARVLSQAEQASKQPRVVWNNVQKRFQITTSGPGIAAFYFDEAQTGVAATEESRKRSSMLFNRTDGWIWEWGGNPEAAAVVPASYLADGTPPSFDPTAPPGVPPGTPILPPADPPPGDAFVPDPEVLPTPSILPMGGMFSLLNFPSTITINSSGAPAGSSMLIYRRNTGAWTPYTGGFSVPPGTRVYAKNVSLDLTRYLDSAEDSEAYYRLLSNISGTMSAQWANMVGKENLVHTITNSLLSDVKVTYGEPASDEDHANLLGFKRVGVFSVLPDTDFNLGQIRYLNGTVKNGTEATAVDLKFNFQIITPAIYNGTANSRLSLWSSPNTSDEADSADYAQLDNPVTDFSFSVDGVTYRLRLRFANVRTEEGWTDGTKLYVYENATGHADLIGRFESSY